jgi:hypothetical protein
VVINNAAIAARQYLTCRRSSGGAASMRTSTARCTRPTFPPRSAEAVAGIINISSLVAVTPEFGRINYLVTSALEGLTRLRLAARPDRGQLHSARADGLERLRRHLGMRTRKVSAPGRRSDAALWLANSRSVHRPHRDDR